MQMMMELILCSGRGDDVLTSGSQCHQRTDINQVADLINLTPGIGVDNSVVILRRIAFAKILIIPSTAGPDSLRERCRCGEVKTLLIINNRARITVNTVPGIFSPFIAGIILANDLRRDIGNHLSSCSSAIYSSYTGNAKTTVQILPLNASIIITGSAPAIP